ncbi:hypothetical protein WOLCODRAFT_146721 [Wolfiporia cocos MD-104 SS10]|uniref:Wax synthase domain-containing protein n=1 Tax=Wolfiporia cocos (strain MD-104) TaxID=742152 RepID=A0A2H3J5Q4_WOLCO|nr:hypothetical protein WOLCODRAFT_146721 [Wolfiporia cocos MD-104 SS10]
MSLLLNTVHLVWFTDPLTEFRHERDMVHPLALPFYRRVFWAQCLLFDLRGVGWNCQVAYVPQRPTEPRWQFVRLRTIRALWWYLLADVLQQCLTHFWPHNNIEHCIVGLARFGIVIAALAVQYFLSAAVTVALGIYDPRDWPDVYGRWSDAYTVRRFWGRVYHQNIRRFTTSFGKRACRLFGLRPGTWASSYTQLYIGFAASGLMHCGGDLALRSSLFGTSFTFYIAQAVAISLEDAATAISCKIIGSGKVNRHRQYLARLVGYVWVVAWLTLSSPWLCRWVGASGGTEPQYVPFSLIEKLVMPMLADASLATTQSSSKD